MKTEKPVFPNNRLSQYGPTAAAGGLKMAYYGETRSSSVDTNTRSERTQAFILSSSKGYIGGSFQIYTVESTAHYGTTKQEKEKPKV